jgi:hypothetical protein
VTGRRRHRDRRPNVESIEEKHQTREAEQPGEELPRRHRRQIALRPPEHDQAAQNPGAGRCQPLPEPPADGRGDQTDAAGQADDERVREGRGQPAEPPVKRAIRQQPCRQRKCHDDRSHGGVERPLEGERADDRRRRRATLTLVIASKPRPRDRDAQQFTAAKRDDRSSADPGEIWNRGV